MLTGEEIPSGPKISEARGLDDVKVFSLDVAGTTLNFAVVNGLGEVKGILDSVAQKTTPLHFVEVMTCPGGCVGGGGQPYGTDLEKIKKRLHRMYEVDRKSKSQLSHENVQVQDLYKDLLGQPLGEKSHHLLHRTYSDRSKG
jgi:iron only hydrogenase large subunit-like protein